MRPARESVSHTSPLRNILLLFVSVGLLVVVAGFLNFVIEILAWFRLIVIALVAYLGLRFVQAIERIADAVEQLVEEESQ